MNIIKTKKDLNEIYIEIPNNISRKKFNRIIKKYKKLGYDICDYCTFDMLSSRIGGFYIGENVARLITLFPKSFIRGEVLKKISIKHFLAEDEYIEISKNSILNIGNYMIEAGSLISFDEVKDINYYKVRDLANEYDYRTHYNIEIIGRSFDKYLEEQNVFRKKSQAYDKIFNITNNL